MGNVVPVTDMSNAFIEHSMVINNFVIKIGSQISDSLCRVFGDSVKYKWQENGNLPVIPDVSINCDIRNRRSTTFMGVPRFIMEVLSDATESYDRGMKMELYKKVEVPEYWIADWKKRKVEIYVLSPVENSLDDMEYMLYKTITEENKGELRIGIFPNLKISFDELFNI